MRDRVILRIRSVGAVIIVVALVLVGRLYVVQIVKNDTYTTRGDRQYVYVGGDTFDRGSIFFESNDGRRISAATLQSGFTVAINPKLIKDAEELYEALRDIVVLDRDDFMMRAARTDDPYEVIANRVSEKVAEEIQAKKFESVMVIRENWRYYPGEDLAAQVIGFVGFDEDRLEGRYGIERYYDDFLRRDSDGAYINFFAEVFSNVADAFSDTPRRGSGDVVLTIEPSVQSFLESTIDSVESAWSSDSVGGIVINPQNGDIYAMALAPRFDLNNFQSVEKVGTFGNPLVESVFEMGSIIKPLTIAAGLDAGAITPETTYNDKGSLTLDTYTISNFDGKARGVVSMQEVLSQSLNTGVAYAVSKMGKETFAKYMRAYGLGEETGIDLPGEVRGFLDNLDSPRDIEYATASYGQGIAMTPIATVRALATLGNGGRLITPHVVKYIDYDVGPAKKVFYDPDQEVLDPETSEDITRMLVAVVDDALLGGTVRLPQYSVAAKTGTAQIASPMGGYYDDRFFHSFFGYFPAYDPQFLIFLYNNEPKGASYASQTLTNPFIDIVKFLISYYEIPPDR